MTSLSFAAGTGPRMMEIALADLENELPPPGSPFVLEIQVAEREAEANDGDDAGDEGATPSQRSSQVAAAAQSSINSANAGLVLSSMGVGPAGSSAVSISPASDDRASIAASQAMAAERAAAAAAAERSAAASAASAAAAAASQQAAEVAAAQQVASALPIQITEQTDTQATANPAPTTADTTPVNNTPPANPTPPVVTPTNPNPGPDDELVVIPPPPEEDECPSDEPCEGVELAFDTATRPTELVSGGKALFFRSARASKGAINLRDQKHLDRICLEIFRAGRALPPECRDHIHPHKH